MAKNLLRRIGRGTALAVAGLIGFIGTANAGIEVNSDIKWIPPKYEYIDFTRIGCSVIEKDGSYWVREKEGWKSYNADGTEQGSWLGDDLNYPHDENIRNLIEKEDAEHNCIKVGYHTA